jgi:hypothetical protein
MKMRKTITGLLMLFLYAGAAAQENPFMNIVNSEGKVLINYTDHHGNYYKIDLDSPQPIVEATDYGTPLAQMMSPNRTEANMTYTRHDGTVLTTSDGVNWYREGGSAPQMKPSTEEWKDINKDMIVVRPNPSNTSTSIDFYAPEGQLIVKMNSVDGILISELYRAQHNGGGISIPVETSRFGPGYYFITIQTAQGMRFTRLKVE